MTRPAPSVDEAQRFYEDFSLATGLRDWLVPNPRHEQLKLFIDDLLHGRRDLRIADIGCGGGVLTAHLRRYGEVTGLDFSHAAVELARKLAPGVRFIAGSLEALPADERFDVITLFDVLEHIPQAERAQFLSEISTRLADDGILFVSTPFPRYTRYKRENGDDALQIIDEEVELPEVTLEAASAGLQLLRFQAYDVFRGSPEYQMMVFTTERQPGGPAALRTTSLEGRLEYLRSRRGRRLRKLGRAAHLVAHRRPRAAAWVLRGTPPHVRS
jgi:SAM-dependent methyltransferase